MTICFSTPVIFQNPNSCLRDKLLNYVENYFALPNATVFITLPPHDLKNPFTRVGSFHKYSTPFLLTVIKIISYITLIIPLIMLIAKAILRFSYLFLLKPIGTPSLLSFSSYAPFPEDDEKMLLDSSIPPPLPSLPPVAITPSPTTSLSLISDKDPSNIIGLSAAENPVLFHLSQPILPKKTLPACDPNKLDKKQMISSIQNLLHRLVEIKDSTKTIPYFIKSSSNSVKSLRSSIKKKKPLQDSKKRPIISFQEDLKITYLNAAGVHLCFEVNKFPGVVFKTHKFSQEHLQLMIDDVSDFDPYLTTLLEEHNSRISLRHSNAMKIRTSINENSCSHLYLPQSCLLEISTANGPHLHIAEELVPLYPQYHHSLLWNMLEEELIPAFQELALLVLKTGLISINHTTCPPFYKNGFWSLAILDTTSLDNSKKGKQQGLDNLLNSLPSKTSKTAVKKILSKQHHLSHILFK